MQNSLYTCLLTPLVAHQTLKPHANRFCKAPGSPARKLPESSGGSSATIGRSFQPAEGWHDVWACMSFQTYSKISEAYMCVSSPSFYVYVCICICTYMRISEYIYIYTYHIHTCTQRCVCTYFLICMCLCACLSVCLYVCMYVCLYV